MRRKNLLAAMMVGLAFVAAARADDAPSSPPSAVAVSAPTPPDTSQAVDAAAAQLGATNLDVSVRIDSPGDNGAVAQTIAAQADAGQTTAQTADTTQAAPIQDGMAQAGGTQVAPTNVAVSIRIA